MEVCCFNNVESALSKIATLSGEAEGVGREEGRHPGLPPRLRAEAEGGEVAASHILSPLLQRALRINIQSRSGPPRRALPHQYLLRCSIALNFGRSDALGSACGVPDQLHLLPEQGYAAVCPQLPP